MCLETMDARSKHTKPDCLRKTMKPGPKLSWRQLRVPVQEARAEAFKPCRASAMRPTTRKFIRRQERREQLVKLAQVLGDMSKTEKTQYKYAQNPNAACVQSQPARAMAPRNTTQYLMDNVYEDMEANHIQTVPVSHETSAHLYSESLSPSGVYSALDSDYESCLAFQQREFEEVFDL